MPRWPSDTVYVIVSEKSGVPLTVYATEEDAQADVSAVHGRFIQPFVLRGGLVTPQRRSTDVRL